MMHPKYERARVLDLAVQAAVQEMHEPIELIQVTGGEIEVRSRTERVRLGYAYHNAYAPDGSSMPGGGNWSVEVLTTPTRSTWRRLFGKP